MTPSKCHSNSFYTFSFRRPGQKPGSIADDKRLSERDTDTERIMYPLGHHKYSTFGCCCERHWCYSQLRCYSVGVKRTESTGKRNPKTSAIFVRVVKRNAPVAGFIESFCLLDLFSKVYLHVPFLFA